MIFIQFLLITVEHIYIYLRSDLHIGIIMSSKVLSSSLFLCSFVTNLAKANSYNIMFQMQLENAEKSHIIFLLEA